MKVAIEGDGFNTSTLKSLAALSSAIDTLNGDEDAAGSVQKAIIDALGEEPTINEGTGRFIVLDLGDNQTVANAMAELLNGALDYADAAVSALENQLIAGEMRFTDLALIATELGALDSAIQALSDGTGRVTNLETLVGTANTATAPAASNATGLFLLLETSISSAVSALETKLVAGELTFTDLALVAAELRNVSTTLRQWLLDFKLGFPPFSLVDLSRQQSGCEAVWVACGRSARAC